MFFDDDDDDDETVSIFPAILRHVNEAFLPILVYCATVSV